MLSKQVKWITHSNTWSTTTTILHDSGVKNEEVENHKSDKVDKTVKHELVGVHTLTSV